MKRTMSLLLVYALLAVVMLSCAEDRTINILKPSAGDDYSNGCTSMSPLPISWESNSYTGTVSITLENSATNYSKVIASNAVNDGTFQSSGFYNYATVFGCLGGFKVTITHNESGVTDTSGNFTLW